MMLLSDTYAPKVCYTNVGWLNKGYIVLFCNYKITFTSIFNSPIIEIYNRIFSEIDFHIGEII